MPPTKTVPSQLRSSCSQDVNAPVFSYPAPVSKKTKRHGFKRKDASTVHMQVEIYRTMNMRWRQNNTSTSIGNAQNDRVQAFLMTAV